MFKPNLGSDPNELSDVFKCSGENKNNQRTTAAEGNHQNESMLFTKQFFLIVVNFCEQLHSNLVRDL